MMTNKIIVLSFIQINVCKSLYKKQRKKEHGERQMWDLQLKWINTDYCKQV